MRWLVRRKIGPMNSGDILSRRLIVPTPAVSPLPLPSPKEVHFWYVVPDEVKDVSLLNQYIDLLSPCEKQSILDMNKDKVQKGAVLARALVRTTLARYTNFRKSPSSLKFRKSRFGKPEVEWIHDDHWVPPSLHFNISHTSSLIACGVTTDVPIGIDIEEKQRKLRNNLLAFARRYFSPNEVEFLLTFSDPESQQKQFLKLWTLKEAYVKALGRGFSGAPFKDFTIRFEGRAEQVPENAEEQASKIVVEVPGASKSLTANWKFALFELNSSHYAAICVERGKEMRAGKKNDPLRIKVWKTLPLVEDDCVSETDAVLNISGLSSADSNELG